ncbi:hypothetical protein [Dysgonomonas sp. Marseille-P4361]|uniref:hypothetical protein n=1 Tax=Dysgonomonas sp. Marseille-P4361 TaxID=2161820 RepID=UPI000D55AFBC|nr:hypothetical protein [Dysgonomonas sp. Marseille-P4361]
MADTQVKAANLLLDRGIRFNIPDAPFLDRIRRKNKLLIRPLRGGTIAEIAVLILENELNKPLTNVELHARLKVISKIIATAILNDKEDIALKRDELAERLHWKIPAHILIKAYRYIEDLNEYEGFTNITNFFNRTIKVIMTKRTGQKIKGSQKSEQE